MECPGEQSRILKDEVALGSGFSVDHSAPPYLATVVNGPVMGEIVWAGPKPFEATVLTPCWICQKTDQHETLFVPCQCEGVVHRHCFRRWRQGWINPRNYFACPNCLTRYNLERVRERPLDTERRIRSHFHFQLFKLLVGVLLVIGGLTFAVAGIAYASDPHKNVPVAVKYLLSSVVNGVPSGNATEVWEANFKSPNVRVWPYYTLFAIFIVSILVLVLFTLMGCTFDEKDRRVRPCCEDCCDRQTCTGCYIYQPCPDCNGCHCSDCGNCSGCGNCGSCDLKCNGGGGGEAILIILFIIAVAVILSALFVLIFYVIRKSALLYDRYTHMLLSQAEELEGDTIVLGLSETWRPLNTV